VFGGGIIVVVVAPIGLVDLPSACCVLSSCFKLACVGVGN